MAPPQIPPFLTTTWQFQQRELLDRWQEFQESSNDWGISELAQAQVIHQVTAYEKLLEDQELSYRSPGRNSSGLGVRSLLAMSAGQLISILENSDEFNLDLATLATNINSSTVLALLRDPRLPYIALRSFMALSDKHALSEDVVETAKSKIDIDEVILANEAYIRSRGGERNKDSRGLASLSHADTILGSSSLRINKATGQSYRVIVRKDPPKGGFEFFDAKRPRALRIQPSQEAFNATFNRLTNNILKDLNWDNVFVAGGIVLTTLLHVDPHRDYEVQDNDIDLYIYGLTAPEAKNKVREIYNVWSRNLPSGNNQKLVIKNAKTITLLADYPNRRIQIILKLVPCPTTVLLNFDLDPCALGFDGKDVRMLPRCARALETGYSTFTMDLLWGHHLGDRRATQPARVLKYADRGFGFRILPSYVRSLEEDYFIEEPRLRWGDDRPAVKRRLNKIEPGLKILKRIDYLGKDMVHRFYFGKTPLTRKPEWMDDEDWEDRVENYERDEEETPNGGVKIPNIRFDDLDTRGLHQCMPNGRRGVGGFEIWMRHHEAWKLDAEGKARLDMTSLSSTMYDGDEYDDLPKYKWSSNFNAGQLSQSIDSFNDQIFQWLKLRICDKLGIPYHQSGWRDYLTRKIRRQVHGPDIDAIFEKQITIPVEIPFELEDFINTLVQPVLEKEDIFNGNEGERQLLIPVHEVGKGNSIIRDIVDSHNGGNLRYWVIGNEVMWAGIDRGIDEVSEVLWTLFNWSRKNYDVAITEDASLYQIALAFRSRLPRTFDLRPLKIATRAAKTSTDNTNPPPATSSSATSSSTTPADITTADTAPGAGGPSSEPEPPYVEPTCYKPVKVLSEAEKRLFQQWAFHIPLSCESQRRYAYLPNNLYTDDGFKYPVPEGLFWSVDDEDAVAKSGDVEWVDVEEEVVGEEKEIEVDIDADADAEEADGESQGLVMGGAKRKRQSS